MLEEELAEAPETVRRLYEEMAARAVVPEMAEEAVRLQEAYLRARIVGPR